MLRLNILRRVGSPVTHMRQTDLGNEALRHNWRESAPSANCCDELPLSLRLHPPKQASAQERLNALAATANERAGVSTNVPYAGMGGNTSAHRNSRHTQGEEVRSSEQLWRLPAICRHWFDVGTLCFISCKSRVLIGKRNSDYLFCSEARAFCFYLETNGEE